MADSVLLIGALILAGLACGWAGLPLLLQKDAMVGDGISHAVLPGIVLAFFLSGSREPIPMLLGALGASFVMVFLIEGMTRVRIVPRDAALGASFSVLFALGVIGLNRVARQVDLDPGCVIYGLAELIPLDGHMVGGVFVPRAFYTVFPAALLAGVIVWVSRRMMLMALLDPAFAQMRGYRPRLVRLMILMGASAVVVACFESVGSILVVALLVGPGIAALQWTHRFERAFGLVAVFAVLNAIVGVWGAQVTNSSIAGMVAICCGLSVVISVAIKARLRQLSPGGLSRAGSGPQP